MVNNRRGFLKGATVLGAGLFARKVAAQEPHVHEHMGHETAPMPQHEEGAKDGRFRPIVTPDLGKLPWHMEGGVKVFELTAEPVKREFLPGKLFDVWGYSGSMPGPSIEVMEGDRVRIEFHNKLPEATSMHWHGLEVPVSMDGMPGISQPVVEPGGRFTYEFTLRQNGTFFYHSHMAMQEMMGMIGLFVVHPRKPHLPRVDRDYGLILQEWAILPNNTIPNTLSMEFNWLTINGKAGPDTTPMLVKHGERVRIRMVNLGMDHHPMHIHGNQFYVTGTEGGRIPESAWFPGNTVLVGVAQARDVEFDARNVGDWMLHCHLPHHMMNAMVSMVGPMAHAGSGAHTGLGMEEGMGVVRQGNALSEELGPGFGRGMGMTTLEKRVSAAVGQAAPRQETPASPTPQMQHQHHGGETMSEEERRKVPGYPQDMVMIMDEMVAKPETHLLAPGWTAGMMGMMTLVRVLPPEKYAAVMEEVRKGGGERPKPAEAMHPHHG